VTPKPTAWAFSAAKVKSSVAWFWNNLSGWCLPLWENSGTSLADIDDLGKNAALAGSSPPTWAADALGAALAFNGGGGWVDFVSPTTFPDLMGDGSFTFFAIVRPNIDNVDYNDIFADYDASASYAAIRVSQMLSARALVSFYTTGMATAACDSATGRLPKDQLAVIVVTWDRSDSAHHTMTLYVNGVTSGASPSIDVGAAELNNNAAQRATIGASGAYHSGNGFSGNILCIGAQRGVWTPAEITAFSADPLAVLAQGGAWPGSRQGLHGDRAVQVSDQGTGSGADGALQFSDQGQGAGADRS
jgi:hypothetical protein